MSFWEKTLHSKTLFEGKVITLQIDTVELPNGKESTREIVRHPGATAILAETPGRHILLVRQFRKPCDAELIEIPAGKLDPGEEPLTCAKRELEEETGMTAKTWQAIHSMYTSPGFADERIDLFYASDLQLTSQHLDEDEFLDVFEADETEIKRLLAEGLIQDAKTLVALHWWLRKINCP